MIPAIFGLAGPVMSESERDFFADAEPAGYILFKRNCADPDQLRALTDSLRALHGRDDVLIMIDQEGGRVSRMQAPEWPTFPAAEPFDRLYDRAPISAIEAARVNARALGLMQREAGITVDALPLLDVRQEGASDIIGDRALGRDPTRVAALGRAVIEGLRSAGVGSIVKHMPGHGRALVDSHLDLPVVSASVEELDEDMAPFVALNWAPMAMTAHIVYAAWDAGRPATLSPTVINSVIRDQIGFDGLLMSDDLDMKALNGAIPDLAAAVIEAGCDVALNCWAKMDDMVGIAARVPSMREESRARLQRAMTWFAQGYQQDTSFAALIEKRDALLALA